MSPREENANEPVGARVVLECGHRLSIPLGLSPEVAAAELLHHRTVCEVETGLPILPGLLFASSASRSFPGVNR